MPVLDHIGHARRRAAIVLQHAEAALAVAHEVGAVDVDVGAVRQRQPAHLRAVVGVAQHQLGRDEPVLERLLRAVDVGQEQVEGLHALAHAGLDHRPVGGGDDPRDHVERQDAVDRVAVAVDREGDALVVQLGFGGPRPMAELRRPQRVQPIPDQLPVGALQHALQQLAEIAGRIVAGQRSRRRGRDTLRLHLHRPNPHANILATRRCNARATVQQG